MGHLLPIYVNENYRDVSKRQLQIDQSYLGLERDYLIEGMLIS